MHCPFCQHEDTRVIDSRLTEDGGTVRRRRECPQCSERFNTFETAELKLPAIVKSGDRREPFDEHKLRVSFERALQKRPVPSDAVDAAMRAVTNDLRRCGEREVPSRQVGELVMRELKALDQVAYVRFASVYRRFEDVHAFREEIEKLERDLPSLEGLQLPLLEAARRGRKGLMSRPFFQAMDHVHMAHALRLAARGMHTTQPNPRVGCVIARGETVLGTGFHPKAGEPHAEVFALREAGEAARGATAYVTLEPCAHHGRTPPCADALIAAGVGRVVIAHEDPFTEVDGKGIEKLRAAGIGVQIGLMRDAAHDINVGFFSRIQRGRPWVRVKLAMSLDGRTALADGSSKWITGEAARADVQRWRARASAILSASGTVLADDPHLTVRLPEGEAFVPPLRAILDSDLRTPAGFHVLDATAPTVLLHATDASVPAHLEGVARAAIRREAGKGLDLRAALHWLAGREVNEVHVEAGPVLCGALLAEGLADELLIYVAPVLLGHAARPMLHLPPLDDMASRWKLETIDRRQVGDDTRLLMRPVHA